MVYLLYPVFKGKHPDNAILESIAVFLTANSIANELKAIFIDEPIPLNTTSNSRIYLNLVNVADLEKLYDYTARLKTKGATIMVGGHFQITINANDILKWFKDIDIVIRAPSAELALLDTAKALQGNLSLHTVKGITFRDTTDKKIIHTKRTQLPANIDHLESPSRKKSSKKKWHPLVVSSGCNGQCKYCTGHIPYNSDLDNPHDFWRKKTESKIVDEIQALVDRGVDSFDIHCNEFLGITNENKQFVANLANEIIKRSLSIRFRFTAKPRNIRQNSAILPFLVKAGLHEVFIGLDSGLERFHNTYKTGSNTEDCRWVLDYFHKCRLNFDIYYIFYDPFLTIHEIKEILLFLREIYPYFSFLPHPYSRYLDMRVFRSALILKPGMPIVRDVEEANLIIQSPGFPIQLNYHFLDSKVMIVYSAYNYVNKLVLSKIRHFFYDRELTSAFNGIDHFLLHLMENIVTLVENTDADDLKNIVSRIEIFTKNFFGAIVDDIFDRFPKYRDKDLIAWMKK